MPASMKHVISVPWTDEERAFVAADLGQWPWRYLIGRSWAAPSIPSPNRRGHCAWGRVEAP